MHHASMIIIFPEQRYSSVILINLSDYTHVCALLQEAQHSLEAAVPAMFQPYKHAELTCLFGIITMAHLAGSTALVYDIIGQILYVHIKAVALLSVNFAYVTWRFAKPRSHLWA